MGGLSVLSSAASANDAGCRAVCLSFPPGPKSCQEASVGFRYSPLLGLLKPPLSRWGPVRLPVLLFHFRWDS